MKKVWNIISYPVLAVLIVLAALEFIPAVKVFFTHLNVYKWLLIGVGVFLILCYVVRPLVRGRNSSTGDRDFFNIDWLSTFTHELSHTIAGMLMLHNIHNFRASIREGEMQHSGKYGSTFITLAPYTLLIYTFPVLLFRLMGQNAFIYIVDFLVGLTLAFHIRCFCTQTGFYQPDLKKVGLVKSAMYISFWHLFNASLIILSIRKGVWGAIGYLFTNYWHDLLKLIPGV
jgi:hypothetical protein